VVEKKWLTKQDDRSLDDKKEAENSIDEKERLLSMASHELRSPLNVILGMVELLSEEINGDGKSDEHRYLGLIKNAAKDLARLADDILNFAKLESGYFEINTEVVQLEEVLMNSYMTAMHQAEEKGVKLARSEKIDWKVSADKNRLKQVIVNLLTNAVKYTEPGGEIYLSTEKDDQLAIIHIEDTGIGIPPDKIDHIFQPFIQMNDEKSASNKSGFGLGLPISKRFTDLMGGDLAVTSTQGEGSVFTVKIPLADS
jgi:signal transduction histidine kinase